MPEQVRQEESSQERAGGVAYRPGRAVDRDHESPALRVYLGEQPARCGMPYRPGYRGDHQGGQYQHVGRRSPHQEVSQPHGGKAQVEDQEAPVLQPVHQEAAHRRGDSAADLPHRPDEARRYRVEPQRCVDGWQYHPERVPVQVLQRMAGDDGARRHVVAYLGLGGDCPGCGHRSSDRGRFGNCTLQPGDCTTTNNLLRVPLATSSFPHDPLSLEGRGRRASAAGEGEPDAGRSPRHSRAGGNPACATAERTRWGGGAGMVMLSGARALTRSILSGCVAPLP